MSYKLEVLDPSWTLQEGDRRKEKHRWSRTFTGLLDSSILPRTALRSSAGLFRALSRVQVGLEEVPMVLPNLLCVRNHGRPLSPEAALRASGSVLRRTSSKRPASSTRRQEIPQMPLSIAVASAVHRGEQKFTPGRQQNVDSWTLGSALAGCEPGVGPASTPVPGLSVSQPHPCRAQRIWLLGKNVRFPPSTGQLQLG